MLARRTGRRRVNDALAVVSPLAFADAVETYVTTLPGDDLRALVQRSVKRMDPSERMQFALFLGHDVAPGGIDEMFSGATMRAEEVQRLVDACTDFLPNRFAAFLRENPRAVPALGDDAVNGILATLPLPRSGVRALPAGERRRVPLQGVFVFAFALLIAVVPLAAQYIRQRGMVGETVNPPVLPVLPATRVVARDAKTPPQKTVRSRTLRAAIVRSAHPKHATPKRVVALAPVQAEKREHAAAPKHVTHRAALRVASVWKFDPRYNPYFNHHARFAPIAHTERAAAAPARSTMSSFEARARLVVSSYLGAVIAGDTPRALKHLGLPLGSDPKAISESSIVSRGTRANIVAVKPGDDGTTHVQVDIVGRRGEYFEVFSVTPDGPAVRIKDRFYIPVNRTAEEISARLLARTPH
jgi:hypothetical protein